MFDVRSRSPRPRWGALYAVTGLLLGLLGTVEAGLPAGAPRRALEGVGVAVLFGAMALWIRFNRTALALEGGAVAAPSRGPAVGPRCPTCHRPLAVDPERPLRK